MKNTLKGKMVKTERPKVDVNNVNCECLECNWKGDIIDTRLNDYGSSCCPECLSQVVIFED